MKRILLLSEIFPPQHGGSGRWFWEIYTRLSEQKVFFVVGDFPGAVNFDRSHNFDVKRMNLSSQAWGLRSIVAIRFYLSCWWRLSRLVRKNRIQEIHCARSLPEGVIALLIKVSQGVQYRCYVHGEDVETASTSKELSFLTKLVMYKAKQIICNSQNSAEIVLKNWKIPTNRISVMHPGVDVAKFQNDLKFERPPNWNERTVLLTVGRLQKRKGHDMAIRALPTIRKSIPNIHYCIVGDGAEYECLKRLSLDLDVADNVEFLTDIDDGEMVARYQNCDLFILPNRTVDHDIEGFGIVLLEAQACGAPVLAGNSGGTKETMEVGKTGVIVDCTDPKALAQTLIKLLEDMDELKSMGQKGRDHVKHNFDWTILAKRAQRLFDKN